MRALHVPDPGKATLLLVAMIGGFILWAIGEPDGKLVVVAVVGYLTGNGVVARKGADPVPVIGRKRNEER